MRAVVVADIHANLEAFRAVLTDAAAKGPIDALWCLGDVIGYGPDPEACIQLLRNHPHEVIVGNHDLAAIGAISTTEFNPYAAAAARWTAEQLTPESTEWLQSLSSALVLPDGFTLAHGSLVDPVWDYLVSPHGAAEHLAAQTTAWGLVGHTHLPHIFYEDQASPPDVREGRVVSLEETRFVANPGSVGQPRDGDPRAAYAIVDTDAAALSFHRIEYDVHVTQAKIHEAGLPGMLAERLAHGH